MARRLSWAKAPRARTVDLDSIFPIISKYWRASSPRLHGRDLLEDLGHEGGACRTEVAELLGVADAGGGVEAVQGSVVQGEEELLGAVREQEHLFDAPPP